jgi:hypothetical protein
MVFIALDVGIEIAKIEKEWSAGLILHYGNDLALNQAP